MTKARDLSAVPNQSLGFKNRIINGDMRIDQRNASASRTISNSTDTYYLDRWAAYTGTNSNNTIQQVSTAPTGYINSLQVTIGTGAAPSAGTPNYLYQVIEGLNCADLGWGTANAQTVTLSFWVRSSLTGTFSGALSNNAVNRSYPFTYTISSTNTWEQKSVTIAGDTSGTWLTTNGVGIRVWFDLGSGSNFQGTAGAWAGADRRAATGSTQLVATSGATLFLTGVQLERGSTATSFDTRSYGTELDLCMRYFQRYSSMSQSYPLGPFGYVYSDTQVAMGHTLPTPMRATPTISSSDVRTRGGVTNGTNHNPTISSFSDIQSIRPYLVTYTVTVSSSGFLAGCIAVVANNFSGDSSFLSYSAEL